MPLGIPVMCFSATSVVKLKVYRGYTHALTRKTCRV